MTVSLPSVPAGSRVYAIGDVHGRADLLAALQAKILAHAAEAPEPRRVAVYCGDYVDRGPDSKAAIDLVLDGLPDFERVFLAGNHEAMMQAALRDPEEVPLWLRNGGAATLASYGVTAAGRAGVAPRILSSGLAAALPGRHALFLAGLRLHHVEGGYLFVHAGLRPGVPLDRQDPKDLLWIREPFLGSDADFGHVVVHGHTPVNTVTMRRNRINIDTGAVWTGVLTALVLHGYRRELIQTG